MKFRDFTAVSGVWRVPKINQFVRICHGYKVWSHFVRWWAMANYFDNMIL